MQPKRFYQIKSLSLLFGMMIITFAAARSAQAEFIFNISQDGPDVLVTGSGTINMASLVDSGSVGTGVEIAPDRGQLVGGGTSGEYYTGVSTPGAFGPGHIAVSASSYSGDFIGVDSQIGGIFLPSGYVSDTLLSNSATYQDTTLAGIGLTNGTYAFTWGTGPTADSILVNVGVPEPAPFAVALLGMLVWLGSYRRHRPTPAA